MLLFIIGASYWSIRKCSISIHLMLLFIGCTSANAPDWSAISIHLMLLFIENAVTFSKNQLSFQYISCYCLSSVVSSRSFRFFYFNTSHVTVYRRSLPWSQSDCSISIHLMLLFIDRPRSELWTVWYISIHLMLLFIDGRNQALFNYIHFNTSHVTVYLYSPTCLFL